MFGIIDLLWETGKCLECSVRGLSLQTVLTTLTLFKGRFTFPNPLSEGVKNRWPGSRNCLITIEGKNGYRKWIEGRVIEARYKDMINITNGEKKC